MKNKYIAALALITLTFAGCQTRSISNSGYERNYGYGGELSELSVLGVTAKKTITEDDIKEAFNSSGKISLNRGDKIVLVQSGAQFPDDFIIREAEKYYRTIPVSGVPNEINRSWHNDGSEKAEEKPLDMALRLTAARAGAKVLIVYWGVLESSREGYASKTVSWVPIIGSFFPDEDQKMRIRLKVAIIDVETGYWEMLTPAVYEDERSSARINRKESDQSQVNLLKEKGYKRLIEDIRTRYEE